MFEKFFYRARQNGRMEKWIRWNLQYTKEKIENLNIFPSLTHEKSRLEKLESLKKKKVGMIELIQQKIYTKHQ